MMITNRSIIDITPAVTPALGVWPGDTPVSREVLMDMQRGDNLTLSTLRATVHLGAHADGPNHYGKDAPSIDQRSLDYYLGACRVIYVTVARGSRVTVADVEKAVRGSNAQLASDAQDAGSRRAGIRHATPAHGDWAPVTSAQVSKISVIGAARLLIATGTFPDPCRWNNDFAALEPELVHWLHNQGVITIGLDTPSVDVFDSKDLPAHNAFLQNDMAILEGLVLKVPEGFYELIALPLPLVGFDASPVRAILRPLPSV